jgi:hypothetical protein
MAPATHKGSRLFAAVGVHRIVCVALATAALAACQTMKQEVSHREDSLSAAGFMVRPANTPARQTMLNSLPPHRFVMRTNGGVVHYVYADPIVCDCLYVGSEQAFNQYKQHVQQQKLADERALTAEMYSSTSWNWGAWSPGRGFAYGPGMGW